MNDYFLVWWFAGWMFTGAFKCGKVDRDKQTWWQIALMFLWWPASLGESLREVMEKNK